MEYGTWNQVLFEDLPVVANPVPHYFDITPPTVTRYIRLRTEERHHWSNALSHFKVNPTTTC